MRDITGRELFAVALCQAPAIAKYWNVILLQQMEKLAFLILCLDHESQIITIDKDGSAEFYCRGGSVSVWVDKSLLPKLKV